MPLSQGCQTLQIYNTILYIQQLKILIAYSKREKDKYICRQKDKIDRKIRQIESQLDRKLARQIGRTKTIFMHLEYGNEEQTSDSDVNGKQTDGHTYKNN